MKFHLTILFILITTFLFAQKNLVPNSSFEEKYGCPKDSKLYVNCINQSPVKTKSKKDVKFWTQPTFFAFHYFNKCGISPLSTPNNCVSFQVPRTGDAYVGVLVTELYPNPSRRVYIQAKLIEPLIKGEKYFVRVYCSNPGNLKNRVIYSDSTIGFYFSREKIHANNFSRLAVTPQLVNVKNDTVKDFEIWFPVSGIYTAIGGENFITIGNFKSEFNMGKNRNENSATYIFIDDVTVEKVTDKNKFDCNVDSAKINIPFNTYFDCNDTTYTHFIKPIKKGQLFSLTNVVFYKDSSRINTSSEKELFCLSEFLKRNNLIEIEIYSHTNKMISEEQSYELTTDRAKAIADYLIKFGISVKRISYKGYGASLPISSFDIASGKENNERIEFRITKK